MGSRIVVQIIDGRLVLPAVINSPSLRITNKLIEFVIDTGSQESYLSDKEIRKFQISISDRPIGGQVNFGGSTYNYVKIPMVSLYLLQEDKEKGYHTFNINLSALITTKLAEKKVQMAQALPSILGMDFLRDQKIALHVIMAENLAYLEVEE